MNNTLTAEQILSIDENGSKLTEEQKKKILALKKIARNHIQLVKAEVNKRFQRKKLLKKIADKSRKINRLKAKHGKAH
jgi:hypothetical protein